MTANQLRAAIYCRISQDRTGEELGVRRQLEDCRELVRQRGGVVVAEYSDNDLSAFKATHRPHYERLMSDVEAGRITHIAVWHLSRLWRNRRERAEAIEKLTKAQVGVIAVKGPDLDLTTAYGRAMAGLLGEFDTLESEVKSERILAKVTELARAGKIANGGPRPFGYTRIYAGEGKNRKILRDEINPEEAEIIRECAKRLLSGESARSIVRDLNERGIRTSTGGLWTMQGFRWMMRSGRIAGLREHKGRIVGKAVWPAIIDRETHEQLRVLLDSKQRPVGNRFRTHYLTGFVFCADCAERGVKMRVQRHADTKRLKYVCRPRAEGGCGGRVIDLEDLQDFVKRYLVARMSDPMTLRELAARERQEDAEAAKLVDLIEADERRLAALQAAIESEGTQVEEIPELVGSVRAIQKRISEHRAKLSARTSLPADDLPDLAARFDSLDVDRKRALLALFVEKILIGPAQRGRKTFDPSRVDIVPR